MFRLKGAVYHPFVLGLVVSLEEENYEIKSNRESDLGRYDVSLFSKDSQGLGIILESKKATAAVRQIGKWLFRVNLVICNIIKIIKCYLNKCHEILEEVCFFFVL